MADAYFLTTPRNADWNAATDHQIWLNEANRWLGALCFDQGKDCCGRSFDAAYTEAISELALALSKSPTALVGGGASSGGASGAVKRNQLQRFPFLGDVIGCWLNVATGGSRIIARVRS
jgi:hypothetical protein